MNSSDWLLGGDVVYYATVGESVAKMGTVSGWTYGTVERTGLTRQSSTNPSFHILDVDEVVGMYVQGGDSGSMVFEHPADEDAILYGVAFGSNRGQLSYYSPIRHVEDELQLDL